MHIWVLDGDMMEELQQRLNAKHDFGTDDDKEKMVVAIEMLDEIKATAVKINNGFQPAVMEKVQTTTKTK